MEKKLKILFFGHDYFGGQFLKVIVENYSDKIKVAGVSTNLQPQKVSPGKKLKKARILLKKKLFFKELKEKVLFENLINRKVLQNSPPVHYDVKVKAIAQQYNIPMFDSSVVYSGDVREISAFGADYIIIASFGKVPLEVYEANPLSVINFHPSLLPQLRGGCPVYTAIIRGLKETGFSFHLLSQKFDAGPLLYQEKIIIPENQNCRDLEIEISKAGANKLYYLLTCMKNGTILPSATSAQKPSYCFKSYEIRAIIKPLTSNTEQILKQIKACTSWMLGSAYLRVNFRHFYIIEVQPVMLDISTLKKEIDFIDNYGLIMKTKDGVLSLKIVYYKSTYYSGTELLKLKNLLF